MPTAQDWINAAQHMSTNLNIRWCSSDPDVGNKYLPSLQGKNEDQQFVLNSFCSWVLGTGNVTPNSYMNCWQALMYAAFLANLVSRTQLEILHRGAALAARQNGGSVEAKREAYHNSLMTLFGYGNFETRVNNLNTIGDVVFIERPNGGERFKHVMLGTGGQETAWSNDYSQFSLDQQEASSKANFVHTDEYRLLYSVQPIYIAKHVAFPF